MAGYRRDHEGAEHRSVARSPAVHANGDRLQSVIESQIIPRLMMAHNERANTVGRVSRAKVLKLGGSFPEVSREIPKASIGEVADALIRHDLPLVRDLIERERAFGADDKSLLIDLLPAAARMLGDRWLDGTCTFTDVTVGLGAIQTLLRDFTGEPPHRVFPPGERPQIRLLAIPGEQHTLGVLVVAEFFRSAGWDVTSGQPPSLRDFKSEIADRWFDAIGISVSVDAHVAQLPDFVRDIQTASSNPAVPILAGGPALRDVTVDQAEALGLTAIVDHAGLAVSTAEEFLSSTESVLRN